MLVDLGYLAPKERFSWRVRFCDGQRVCINEKGVKYQNREPQYRWTFNGATHTELLAKELELFSVRRPASELSGSLPSVYHTLLEVDVPDMREHDLMWREMKKLMKSNDTSVRGAALGMIGKMISWCAAKKADVIRGLVAERLESGESPVVFCEYLAPLDALRAEFPGQSMMLDGRMSASAQDAAVERFKAAAVPTVLLASRRACGTGKDGIQHRARTVCFMSLPWNSQLWSQAWKRVYREGQKNPVHVITTLARGTYEEAVLELVYRKAGVTDILCSTPSLSPEARADWERVLHLLKQN